MENKSYAVGAGLFVLVAVAILIGAILWFNDRGRLHGVPYDLITRSSVAGLKVGAIVSLRGVQVGQVESIQFDAGEPATIRVGVSVDPQVALRKGTYGTLDYQGLTGDAYVDLDYPSHEHGILTSDPRVPARIPLRRSSWATLPDTGELFLTSFTNTLGRLDSVLSPENAQQLSRLLADVSVAAEQIAAVARDVRPAARRLDSVGSDAQETLVSARKAFDDIDTLAVDVRSHLGILDAVGEGAHQTGLAAQNVEEALVGGSLPKLDSLLLGLSQNSQTLQELLEEIKQQPQSILFGAPMAPPGPGEAGFRSARLGP
jgi:phospholipid/cholesterol/gamma-HCH transport system substrate-binding protein